MVKNQLATSGLLSQWQQLTAAANQQVEYRPDVDVVVLEIDFKAAASLADATVIMEAAGSSVAQGQAMPIPCLVDPDAVDLVQATFGWTYKMRIPVGIRAGQSLPLRFKPSVACTILVKGVPVV